MATRSILSLAVLLMACTRQPAGSEAAVPDAGASAAPPALASPPVSPPVRGELAGMRYQERILGGGDPDERLPMLVVLHPMGGDPEGFVEVFARYPGRARLVLPYGQPRGGMYFWFSHSAPGGAADAAERLAAFLSAIAAARPTLGKPIVIGLSQGALVTYALAVLHPHELAAAFPVSGALPAEFASASREPPSGRLPAIYAFHGGKDPVFRIALARESIAAMRALGYPGELREYDANEHMPDEQEERDLVNAIARVAAGLR